MRRSHKNKYAGVALAAVVLSLGLTACGPDETPRSDPSPPPTSTPSPSTSTPLPTWDSKFTPVQMKRYEAARASWLDFWDFYSEITRKGVDTPGVKQGFEKYTMNPIGERSQFLDNYVRAGVRMEVPPEVLWTSAERITKNQVDFNYCLDSTDSRVVTINGDLAPKSKPRRQLRTVQMVKVGGNWRRLGYLHSEEVRPCGKTAP